MRPRYADAVTTPETQRIIEDVRRLRIEYERGNPEREARLERALARLRERSGKAQLRQLVWEVLRSWEGVVVAHEPEVLGASALPDFLVSQSGHAVLVATEDFPFRLLPRRLRETAERLEKSIDLYGADSALLVVPTGERPPDTSGRVRILTLAELIRLGGLP